jgi:hypothetical protein
MYLLQAMHYDWTTRILPYYFLIIIFYLFVLLIAYLIIRAAVKSGTREHRRQATITNHLLIEQLKIQGVSPERIEEIISIR